MVLGSRGQKGTGSRIRIRNTGNNELCVQGGREWKPGVLLQPELLEKVRGEAGLSQPTLPVRTQTRWVSLTRCIHSCMCKPGCEYQCCGSMTVWCGSGSADPCLWLMDPDLAFFGIDFQDAKVFLLITFWRYIYIIFLKHKKSKRSRKIVGIKVFLTIFAWW